MTNIGNANNDNDAANKNYVDSRKPIIAIWAAENGSLDVKTFEWSWGNGATGSKYGYLMLSDGESYVQELQSILIILLQQFKYLSTEQIRDYSEKYTINYNNNNFFNSRSCPKENFLH